MAPIYVLFTFSGQRIVGEPDDGISRAQDWRKGTKCHPTRVLRWGRRPDSSLNPKADKHSDLG